MPIVGMFCGSFFERFFLIFDDELKAAHWLLEIHEVLKGAEDDKYNNVFLR